VFSPRQPPSAPRGKQTPLAGSWQPPLAAAPPAALQPAHASSSPAPSELRQILEVHEQPLEMPVLALNARHVS